MRFEKKWYLFRLMVGAHSFKVLSPFENGADFLTWLRSHEDVVRLVYPAKNNELIDLYLSIPSDVPVFLDTAFGKAPWNGNVDVELPGLDNYQRPRATAGQRVIKGK